MESMESSFLCLDGRALPKKVVGGGGGGAERVEGGMWGGGIRNLKG